MLYIRDGNHTIKAESQVSEILPSTVSVAQMPLKHSACVVNNGKSQVSSRYSLFHEALRLKYICLT